jgi:hypothetical protein
MKSHRGIDGGVRAVSRLGRTKSGAQAIIAPNIFAVDNRFAGIMDEFVFRLFVDQIDTCVANDHTLE